MRIFVVLLLGALAACRSHAAPAASEDDDEAAGPIATVCVPARASAGQEKIGLHGVIAAPPDRAATVSPQVAGRVLGLRVKEGDRVKPGELLATIEDAALAEAVAESDAGHAGAEAVLANAEAALARARRLFDQGIAPRRDVEDAEARRAAAAAELKAADAKGGLARQQQGKARVTAPIAGVIVKVHRRNGELVDGTPATPLVDIADPAKLELRADAPAAQLVRLREGAAAEVRLDALPGAPLAATLIFVSPAVDTTTSLGVVRAAIAVSTDPAAPQPKLGLAGQLLVEVPGRAGTVLVPTVALRRAAGGGEEVVVCDAAAGVAHLRAVQTGARQGGDVEVVSGLAAGEAVATRHVVALDEGAKIEVAGAEKKPEKAEPPEPEPDDKKQPGKQPEDKKEPAEKDK